MAANRFELLAGWYLRFNGYFTTPDFSVHPDFKVRAGGTDADVLAVRFPHSEEYQKNFTFERDLYLINDKQIDFIISEVKSGLCDINQNSWRNPERKNIEYAIRWMGIESKEEQIDKIAARLYAVGRWEAPDRNYSVRFVSFGNRVNDQLSREMPGVQQIMHNRVIEYLATRFTKDCYLIQRSNWDADLREFATLCRHHETPYLIEWAHQRRESDDKAQNRNT